MEDSKCEMHLGLALLVYCFPSLPVYKAREQKIRVGKAYTVRSERLSTGSIDQYGFHECQEVLFDATYSPLNQSPQAMPLGPHCNFLR